MSRLFHGASTLVIIPSGPASSRTIMDQGKSLRSDKRSSSNARFRYSQVSRCSRSSPAHQDSSKRIAASLFARGLAGASRLLAFLSVFISALLLKPDRLKREPGRIALPSSMSSASHFILADRGCTTGAACPCGKWRCSAGGPAPCRREHPRAPGARKQYLLLLPMQPQFARLPGAAGSGAEDQRRGRCFGGGSRAVG